MHRHKTTLRSLPWVITLTVGMLATLSGHAQPPDPKTPPSVQVDPKTGALIVPLGGLASFDPKLTDPPSDILVSREDILGVRLDPNDPKKLLLTGKIAGLSQLTIVQKDKPALKYDVVVQPDLALLRNVIKRTVPTSNVDVQPGVGNVIVLSGYVTSPQDADTITRLATSAVGGNPNNLVNAIQVGGVQQVQIDVVIASVDRNLLRARGFDFALPGAGNGTSFNSLISGLLGTQQMGGAVGGGVGGAAAGPMFNPNANLQLAIIPDKFFGALQALRSEGVAKFLAEPKVVTQTGRPAFFRAGGQQAILSQTAGITGPGVTLVPFGTQLEVVPIVYGNNMIWLDIRPSVTAVNQGLGINVGGALSPGFSEQSVQSTVLLESGQTFAIGGLIQTSLQASASKVPFIGDLPYIGPALSSVRYETRESELVILVTPRLVHPMDQCQTPKRLPGQETRTPDDYELFLENILEAPRGQRKVWNGKCYNAAYKCDPTLSKYPCAGNVCTGPNGTCLPTPVPGPLHAATGGYAPTPPAPIPPAPANGSSAVPAPMPEPATLPAIPAVPVREESTSSWPPPPVTGSEPR
ncbi:MAG: pilus assembly protein N-terminal domain-containing protein [Gemmataceae bacterium]|nr:pilus assembly protein N-terminal domain-containing protein [Gemmata sp.]MDW8198137.1 pilus assembly protein N-terminal domain-containing protein [Gemmataceae bacterium]